MRHTCAFPALFAVLLAVFSSLGCEQFFCDPDRDEQCEDPTRGHIHGKILLPMQSQSVPMTAREPPSSPGSEKRKLAQRLLRAEVGRNIERFTADPKRRTLPKRKARRPQQTRLPLSLPIKTEPTFRAGELIVKGIHPMRAQKEVFEKRFEEHLKEARVDVKIHFIACNTPKSCLLSMKDSSGKPLSEFETKRAKRLLSTSILVSFAELNSILKMARVPNDDFYNLQWHYSALHLEAAWDITVGDDDVTAAIVDTGVLRGHSELAPRLVNTVDLILDSEVAGDGDGRDDDGQDEGDNACGPNCHSHHGSHVAGTIGAATDNGAMVAGVTWRGGLLGVRVLGKGGGALFDIAGGILWSVGEEVEGVTRNERIADVVNLSLGGPGESRTMNDAVAAAIEAGAIVVVAAGNENVDASTFTPANSPGAIVVGAVGHRGGERTQVQRASYSNFGEIVDVMAPGGEQLEDIDGDGHADGILSTVDDFVTYLQGTSMAAPHVAGVAMLLKSERRDLQQEEVRALLTTTASENVQCDLGCGAGQVNALGALRELKGISSAPFITAEPSITSIGKDDLDARIVFRNIGDISTEVQLFVAGVDKEALVLDQNGAQLSTDEILEVNVVLQRSGTDHGEAEIFAVWGDGKTSTARLIWSDDVLPLAGSVYVGALLEDEAGDLSVARVVTTSELNDWQFELFNLEAGNYLVVGLSDDDADGDYELHEGVGVFPSVQSSELIEVIPGLTARNKNFIVAPGVDLVDDVGSGLGEIGDGCISTGDCRGGLYCDDSFFPGGYCSASCSGDVLCPESAACFCLLFGEEACSDGICLEMCQAGSDCREGEGYLCDADLTCYPRR
ncbi:MAG: S8 family serine peptidase [Deltaproteobacteria bacterium]|nr:S8 family serine peptidase [Deltaproteobacteria bacterium]